MKHSILKKITSLMLGLSMSLAGCNTGSTGSTDSLRSDAGTIGKSSTATSNEITSNSKTTGFFNAIVQSAEPKDKQVEVSRNSEIIVTYNEPVDPTSVTTSTFTVTPSGSSKLAGTISHTSNNKTFTFTPISLLNHATTYQVRLTGIKTTSKFQTGKADNFSSSFITDTPHIAQVTPFDGTTEVPTNTQIKLVYNKPISSEYISEFTLTNNNGNLINGSLVKTGENTETKTITGLTFIPSRELIQNTVYHVNFKGGMFADGKTPLEDFSSSFTTRYPKKIFTTNSRFYGNLDVSKSSIEYDYDNFLSKTGIADAFCNQDPNRPKDTGYFKAMLAISGERHACDNYGNCSFGYNWVLQPDTEYRNSHNKLVGTTNSRGIFDFDLDSGIDINGVDTWTGLASSWHTNANCYDWSSKSGGAGGKVGWSSSTNHDLISVHIHDCNASRALICVEQPQVTFVHSPKYMQDMPEQEKVSIAINLINGVEPHTVNSSTFIVKSNDGKIITGKIVAAANGHTYSFAPDQAFIPSQYKVILTQGITDKTGQAINYTELSFAVRGHKLIFVTNKTLHGDDINGVSDADARCNSDEQCPAGKTCRAIIATNSRQPGDSDWSLKKNTTYSNIHHHIVGTTDDKGLFTSFPLENPIDEYHSGWTAWTGISTNWHVDRICKNGEWGGNANSSKNNMEVSRDSSGGSIPGYTNLGTYGSVSTTSMEAFSHRTGACNHKKECTHSGGCSARHLYCAEQ